MDELLKEEKPRVITLADGKEYKLGPINLNVLANLEEEFNSDLGKLGQKFDKHQASSFRSLLFVLLKENHPEITKEQAGKLVSIDAMPKISELVNEVVRASGAI